MAVKAGTAYVDVVPNMEKFGQTLGAGVSSALKSASAKFQAGFGQIKQLGLGIFGGGALLLGLEKLTGAATDYFESVDKIKDVYGETTENAAQFVAITKAAGVSSDLVARTLLRLDKAAAPVGGKLSSTGEALQGLGINLVDANGKMLPLMDQLQALSDAYQASGDKAQFFANAVGPRGIAVSDVIADYSKLKGAVEGLGIDWAAAVPSEQQVIQLKATQIALDQVKVSIGKALIPFVTALNTAFSGFFTDISNGGNVVTAFFKNIIGSSSTAVKVIGTLFALFTGAKIISAITKIASGLGDVANAAIGAARKIAAVKIGQEAASGLSAFGALGAAAGPVAIGLGAVAAGFTLFKLASDAAHRSYVAGVQKDFQELQGGFLSKTFASTGEKQAAADVIKNAAELTHKFEDMVPAARGAGAALAADKRDSEQARDALLKLKDPVGAVTEALNEGLISYQEYHDALIQVLGSEEVYARDALHGVEVRGQLSDSQIKYLKSLVDSGQETRTVTLVQEKLDEAVKSGTIDFSTYENAVRSAGLQLNVTSEDVEKHVKTYIRFAHMSRKAFKEWATSITDGLRSTITSTSGFDKKWAFTSKSFVKLTNQMLKKSKQIARDFKALDKEAVPDEFKQWLIEQGPDAVHAFEGSSDKAQKTIVKNFKGIDDSADDVEKSVRGLDGTTKALADHTKNTLAPGIDVAGRAFRDAGSDADAYGRSLDALDGKVVTTTIRTKTQGGGSGGDGLPHGVRAHGGPVSALRSYLVGEQGPELFVPDVSGQIIPNAGRGGAGQLSGEILIRNGRMFITNIDNELSWKDRATT